MSKIVTILIVSVIFFSCSNNETSSIGLIDETEKLTCKKCDLVDVLRVIDGDTIDTSLGIVRLYGVDTPEIDEKCFQLAKTETERLAGYRIRVENGPRVKDRYGRKLAYVYTENGDSIDGNLIEKGFAKAWEKDGQHRNYLMDLEKFAPKDCVW
jgi:endonuclease YncB( thermonuclease family)|tara:strand:+ start:136 stop:597 length:462 start_codon:yes stop_codon:yes gene_type:complete